MCSQIATQIQILSELREFYLDSRSHVLTSAQVVLLRGFLDMYLCTHRYCLNGWRREMLSWWHPYFKEMFLSSNYSCRDRRMVDLFLNNEAYSPNSAQKPIYTNLCKLCTQEEKNGKTFRRCSDSYPASEKQFRFIIPA